MANLHFAFSDREVGHFFLKKFNSAINLFSIGVLTTTKGHEKPTSCAKKPQP